MLKRKYAAPIVALLRVKPMPSLLETFSVSGDFEDFEYAGEL